MHGRVCPHYPAPRVLLADAHTDTRDLYALWLRQRGFLVNTAASAHDALSVAWREEPDVVITELVLDGGGPALLAHLRAHPLTCDAVLIVVTTQSGSELRAQALAAGADLYLVKPCGAAQLGEAMADASRSRSSRARSPVTDDAAIRAAQRSLAIRERVGLLDATPSRD